MQTSYSYDAPEGALGLATEDFTKFIDTVIPQVAVVTGTMLTADKTAGKVRNAAKLPALAADIARPGALGVVILDPTREGGVDWPALRATPVMRRGRIWVLAEGAIARWTHPFVRFASGAGGTVLGSFRGDADTASAAQSLHTIALTDAAAGELVLIEVTLF
jgi:hypothetical protein